MELGNKNDVTKKTSFPFMFCCWIWCTRTFNNSAIVQKLAFVKSDAHLWISDILIFKLKTEIAKASLHCVCRKDIAWEKKPAEVIETRWDQGLRVAGQHLKCLWTTLKGPVMCDFFPKYILAPSASSSWCMLPVQYMD